MPIAVVTGAGGEIGRAIVRRLIDDGYEVIGVDHNANGLDNLGLTRSVVADVTDDAAMAQVFADIDALDVLVTTAGVGEMSATAALATADWRRTLDINLTGTFVTCREALPLLMKAKGSIVTIASSGGIRPTPYNAAYCASKAGVVMLTKVIAVEYARAGVRANAVCPNSVRTQFLGGFVPPDGADFDLLSAGAGPAPRLVETSEVADAVAYLVSDSAASITGTTLLLDAGATA